MFCIYVAVFIEKHALSVTAVNTVRYLQDRETSPQNFVSATNSLYKFKNNHIEHYKNVKNRTKGKCVEFIARLNEMELQEKISHQKSRNQLRFKF